MWWDILKTQRTITDSGFDFDLPEEEEPEPNCCEKFRPELEGAASAYLRKEVWKEWKSATCDEIKTWAEACEEWRHIKMHIDPVMKMAGDVFHSIMNKWRDCENE
jgi:hypothetical protein